MILSIHLLKLFHFSPTVSKNILPIVYNNFSSNAINLINVFTVQQLLVMIKSMFLCPSVPTYGMHDLTILLAEQIGKKQDKSQSGKMYFDFFIISRESLSMAEDSSG